MADTSGPSSEGEMVPSAARAGARWVAAAAVGLALLLGAAAFATGYSLASKLWLLAGSLVAAGLVGLAVFYASVAHASFAAESGADRERRRALAESYVRLANGEAAAPRSGDAAGGSASTLERSAALARAAVLTQQAAPDDRAVVAATMLMNIVVFVVSGFAVISFWLAGSRESWASGMVWAAACLLLGGLAGFLFGIPRFRSEGKTPQRGSGADAGRGQGAADDARPVTVMATNDQSPIEQIADWLTKTIVGVALVNLRTLPGQLHAWALTVAGGLGGGSGAGVGPSAGTSVGATSFALGLILYFTVLGFLSGYLLTQFFLQRYVNRHEASDGGL